MSPDSTGTSPTQAAARVHDIGWVERRRRAVHRLKEAAHRMRAYGGPERETLYLLFKSGLAGVTAWVLAQDVIASPQPTYAPFTALLVVQSTAYRSLMQTLRYVLAVVVGVLAAGAAGPLLGQNAWAFAAMLAVALVVGRWQRLGSQGLQVSVAAVFAFNALLGTSTTTVWQIIAMALLGAGVGLAVALLVMPPLRYRTASQGIAHASDALCALLHDMSEGLEQGMPERDTVADWLHRSRPLDMSVNSARQAVESGSESVVWNPRRLIRSRPTPTSFRGYRTLLEALARAGEQMRSICYALLRIIDDPDTPAPGDGFLSSYAELLRVVENVPGVIGTPAGEDGGGSPADGALVEGRARQRDLRTNCASDPAWPTYGVLLTDTERLLEEFATAHDHGAQHPEARASLAR
ncbi:aromatic acid exporter family protein [Streptomyces sp. ODS28]|uniref:FUSC family protein n=1 Tax=Streptomyces sp. ODS28 TaxID=3136688 RepID=UPI0031EC583A